MQYQFEKNATFMIIVFVDYEPSLISYVAQLIVFPRHPFPLPSGDIFVPRIRSTEFNRAVLNGS